MTKILKDEVKYLEAKIRFIGEYISNRLKIHKQSKEFIVKLLENNNYPNEISGTQPLISAGKFHNEQQPESRHKCNSQVFDIYPKQHLLKCST